MPMKKTAAALRHALPAYGGDTWAEVEANLLASPPDAELVAHLEHVLRTEGRFVEPVVLDPTDRTVRNGMHRIVAALRTGVAIDVVWDHPVPCAESELREVTFTAALVAGRPAPGWSDSYDPEVQEIDVVVGALRSIPHDDGWIEAPCFGCHSGTFTATWSPVAGSAMPEDDRLVAILVDRATGAGLALEVLGIEHEPAWLQEPVPEGWLLG